MSQSIDDGQPPVGRWILNGCVFTLVVAGLMLNLYLLFTHFRGADAALRGCSGGDVCDEFLNSRWAYLLGLPVTVYGALAYAGVIFSFTPAGLRLRMPLLGMIAGAAFWFLFVQAVLLGKFCPWCVAAHGIGLALTIIMLLRYARVGLLLAVKDFSPWVLALFLSIGLVQLYGPVMAGHRIDDSVGFPMKQATASPTAGRMVSFDGGEKTYDVSALPRRGPLDAKWVLVEYFDYQCPACSTMADYLDALLAKHPKDLALLLLPVPLDRECNPDSRIGIGHPGSCEITRIALAVWREKPDQFSNFHQALIADPSPESARRLALKILSPEILAAAQSEQWISELIQANIADWQHLSGSVNKLPKLLIRDKRIIHGLPSNAADFIRVMEKELSL